MLLLRYQTMYQGLRATRGFDGLPPIASPRRRLHLPHQTMPWSDSAGRRPQVVSGAVAILLILVVALTVVAGRTEFLLGPQHDSGNPFTNVDGQNTPTFGPKTSTGKPCANVNGIDTTPYSYAIDTGNNTGATLWIVNGCDDPAQFATLPYGNFTALSWSPDAQNLLVIDRDSPKTPTLAIVNVGGHVEQILGQEYPVDEALWISDTDVLVLSRGTVLHVNISNSQQVSTLLQHVGHLELRAGSLFYSRVENGVATLHQRDLQSGTDSVVFHLGAGGDTCPPAGGVCYWTESWDVSSDGLQLAYQYPLPLSVITDPTVQLNAQLLITWLESNATTSAKVTPAPTATPQSLFVLPIMANSPSVQFSPQSTRVAAQIPGTTKLMIFELYRDDTIVISANDTFLWRNDDRAILTTPSLLDHTTAQLYLFETEQTIAQPVGASNFVWQSPVSG